MLAAQDMWEKGRREDLGRWKDNAEDKKKKECDTKWIWSEARSKIWGKEKGEKEDRSIRETVIQRKTRGNLQGK